MEMGDKHGSFLQWRRASLWELGTEIINEYYQINAPGDYWVKLVILAPNGANKPGNIPRYL